MPNPRIYELAYSGPEVDDAIRKIQELDPSSIGGIIELESTETTPYNLNFLRTPGLFTTRYVFSGAAPSGVDCISPVYIYVSRFTVGETVKLIQSLSAGDATYTRSSDDGGLTWDNWVSEDGFARAEEITAEEVDAIFETIFGHEIAATNSSAATISALLSASRAIAAATGEQSISTTSTKATAPKRTVAS